MTREVARRFNHIYGREPGFERQGRAGGKKMGRRTPKLYHGYRRSFQEQGDEEAPGGAALLSRNRISASATGTACRLPRGGGMVILPEPQPLLTKAAKMPGLDGQKMSVYGNTIGLLDASSADVEKQMRTMPTDPARVRRTDLGNPEICPVWQVSPGVFRTRADRAQTGCRSTAGIGLPRVQAAGDRRRARRTEANPGTRSRICSPPDTGAHNIVNEGCERAREVARETMEEVRHAMSPGTIHVT